MCTTYLFNSLLVVVCCELDVADVAYNAVVALPLLVVIVASVGQCKYVLLSSAACLLVNFIFQRRRIKKLLVQPRGDDSR